MGYPIIPFALHVRPPNLHIRPSISSMKPSPSALNNIQGCFRECEICLIRQMQRILIYKYKTAYICLLLRKAVCRSLIIEAINFF